jgi:hypothetical protein
MNESSVTQLAQPLTKHFQSCVERFLKTVVVFDDQAYQAPLSELGVGIQSRNRRATTLDVPPQNLLDGLVIGSTAAAGVSEKKNEQSSADRSQKERGAEAEAEADAEHELDGPGVIREFAKKGIICSVIQPGDEPPNEIVDQIVMMAQGADVIILDWELRKGDHTITLDAIKKIIEDDDSKGGRLRLVVIYTAAVGRHVRKALLDGLQGFSKEDGSPLTLHKGHTAIAILNKPSITNQHGVSSNDLPRAIVEAHVKVTNGLLPAAALTSISIIREHTHQLLNQFGRELDLAYIAHRALVPRPEDAENHFIELISDSLQQLLLNEGCTEALSADKCVSLLETLGHISEWPEARRLSVFEYLHQFDDQKRAKIKESFNIETDNHLGIAKEFLVSLHGRDTDPNRQTNARNARHKMAFLNDFSRHFSNNILLKQPPRLTMGTVVAKDVSDGQLDATEFYLCVQPRCDSVRFNGIRRFPFVRLVSENGTPNIHLKWIDSIKPLSAGNNVYDLEMFSFGTKDVQSSLIEAYYDDVKKKWIFLTENGQELMWAGELRKDKTMRFASKIASRLHVPGINDYEVTRLSD